MTNPFSQLGPDDFQQAGLGLLPPGQAWQRDLTSVLAKTIGAIADVLAMFHRDASTIVDQELYPPTAAALLPDFETDFGLPDLCTPQPQTSEQRTAALLARITDLGNLSRPKFIALAAALGFTVTITEFSPMTCEDTCIDPVRDESWRFAWQVNAPATTYSVLTCEGECTSPLRSWGNAQLECVIRRNNRPSRIVLFSYG